MYSSHAQTALQLNSDSAMNILLSTFIYCNPENKIHDGFERFLHSIEPSENIFE